MYENEFMQIIGDLLETKEVQQMKNYKQHGNISTYEHCIKVSNLSYKICKKLKLDYKSMSRGAMLHDLFLYDWHENKNIKKKKIRDLHAFRHPKIALENARKITNLNVIEEEIILKHMWPVTIKFPKYKETYIITLVDKYCAMNEWLQSIKDRNITIKFYIDIYIISTLLRNAIATI